MNATLQPFVNRQLVHRVTQSRVLHFRVVVLGYLRGGVLQQPLPDTGRFTGLGKEGAERDPQVLVTQVRQTGSFPYLLPFLMRVGSGIHSLV